MFETSFEQGNENCQTHDENTSKPICEIATCFGETKRKKEKEKNSSSLQKRNRIYRLRTLGQETRQSKKRVRTRSSYGGHRGIATSNEENRSRLRTSEEWVEKNEV